MDTKQKMQVVIDLAREALKNGEMPIAAAIFHGDDLMSSCYTSEISDKRYLVHAELKALIEADMKGFSIKKRKEMQLFTNLEPCMMCLGAAMSFFIGEIYYALEAPMDGAVDYANDYWTKACNEIPAYGLPKIYSGLLRSESKSLFEEYLKIQNPGPMYDFAKLLTML